MYYNINTEQFISSLPAQYKFNDGRTTGDFNLMSSSIHEAEGFFQVTEVFEEYDPRYQRLVQQPIDGTTVTYAAVDLPLDHLKERLKEAVNNTRSFKLNNGFDYDGHTYDSDAASVTNITGKVLSVFIGITLEPEFTWRTKDNQDVPMDEEDIVALGEALMGFRTSLYVTSWQHKAAIDALTTGLEVAEYDISTGW